MLAIFRSKCFSFHLTLIKLFGFCLQGCLGSQVTEEGSQPPTGLEQSFCTMNGLSVCWLVGWGMADWGAFMEGAGLSGSWVWNWNLTCSQVDMPWGILHSLTILWFLATIPACPSAHVGNEHLTLGSALSSATSATFHTLVGLPWRHSWTEFGQIVLKEKLFEICSPSKQGWGWNVEWGRVVLQCFLREFDLVSVLNRKMLCSPYLVHLTL